MRNRRTITRRTITRRTTRSFIAAIVFGAATLLTAGAFAQDAAVSPFVPIDVDTYQASQPTSAQTNASDTVDEGDVTTNDAATNDTTRFREGLNPFVQLSIK